MFRSSRFPDKHELCSPRCGVLVTYVQPPESFAMRFIGKLAR